MNEPEGTIDLTAEEMMDQASGWILIATNDDTVAVMGDLEGLVAGPALAIADRMNQIGNDILTSVKESMPNDQG